MVLYLRRCAVNIIMVLLCKRIIFKFSTILIDHFLNFFTILIDHFPRLMIIILILNMVLLNNLLPLIQYMFHALMGFRLCCF